MKHSYVLLCGIISLAIVIPSAFASPEDVQSGEIVLEKDAVRGDSYEVQQGNAIAFLKKVRDSVASGGDGRIENPGDSVLSYLNVAYLYCSVTEGTCPGILDSILEADIINSRAAGTATCPIMTQFWKLYIKSDMEQRHSHHVKTGFLTITDDFKKKNRPAYIRCKETVEKTVAAGNSSARYAADGHIRKQVDRSVRLVEDMKLRVPNLFTALGAR